MIKTAGDVNNPMGMASVRHGHDIIGTSGKPHRNMDADILQKKNPHTLTSSPRTTEEATAYSKTKSQPDDPGKKFAHGRVSVGISTACHGNHGRQLAIAHPAKVHPMAATIKERTTAGRHFQPRQCLLKKTSLLQ